MDYFSIFFAVITISAVLFAVITLIVTAINKQSSPVKVFFAVDLIVIIFSGIVAGVLCLFSVADQSNFLGAFLGSLWIIYCEPPMVVLLMLSGIVWLVTKNKSKKN